MTSQRLRAEGRPRRPQDRRRRSRVGGTVLLWSGTLSGSHLEVGSRVGCRVGHRSCGCALSPSVRKGSQRWEPRGSITCPFRQSRNGATFKTGCLGCSKGAPSLRSRPLLTSSRLLVTTLPSTPWERVPLKLLPVLTLHERLPVLTCSLCTPRFYPDTSTTHRPCLSRPRCPIDTTFVEWVAGTSSPAGLGSSDSYSRRFPNKGEPYSSFQFQFQWSPHSCPFLSSVLCLVSF